MIVHHFVTRRDARGGYSVQSVNDAYWVGIALLCAIFLFLFLIAAAIVDSQYKAVGSYQVDGTVLSYGTTGGKSKHVTVWLQQHDGIRNYSTGVSPDRCVCAKPGTNVPIRVTNMRNSWTNQTQKRVALVYNPCKEI